MRYRARRLTPPHRAASAGLPVDADMRSAVESVIEAGASTFCIDYLSGKLRSVETEDTIDIGLDMVRQFISAGVLVQVGETEFGEPEYAFQWCAISWTRGSDITTGAQALCSHIDLSRPLSNQKLSLILYMHRVGWITEGGLLNRLHSRRLLMLQGTRGVSRSKAYYACLAIGRQVLERIPLSSARLPMIHHGLPEKYYKIERWRAT